MNSSHRLHLLGLLCLTITLLAGCGGEQQQTKNKDFYTSGNPEADQRAQQRMAQHEQLTGESTNSEGKSTKSQADIANDKKPLYDRLGGDVGVKMIVDDFIPRVLADPRVNFQRIGVKRGGLSIHRGQSETWDASQENIDKLKQHMVQFFALSTGGPTEYSGKEMKSTHANMHISNAEFDAAVGDLKQTLDKLQIANKEQKELLAVIETTRDQIVTEK